MFSYATVISFAVIMLSALPLTALALDDPTQPPIRYRNTGTPTANDQPVMHWDLSSILIAPKRRLAVINGQTVGQGDFIGEARVTVIETDGVTLSISGQLTQLRLLPVLKKQIKR